MILIEIRCSKCRGRLGTIETAPTDWGGTFNVMRCRKCYVPPPGKLVDVLVKAGEPAYGLSLEFPLNSVRKEIAIAQKTGKTVVVSVQDPGVHAIP